MSQKSKSKKKVSSNNNDENSITKQKGKSYFFFDKCLIKAYGSELFSKFVNSDDRKINAIYVPSISDFEKVEKENPNVENFINYVFDNGKKDPEKSHIFKINDYIKIIFKEPTKDEIKNYKIEAVTTLPSRKFDLIVHNGYDEDKVNYPRFEKKLESLLDYGFVEQRVSHEKFLKVRDNEFLTLSYIEKGITKVNFINQFYNVTNQRENDSQICKIVSKDFLENKCDALKDSNSEEKKHLQNILKIANENNDDLFIQNLFYGLNTEEKNDKLNSSFFNIKPNSIEQYLALNHLILDPKVKLIFITGAASSGKTQLSIAGSLYQLMTKTVGTKEISPNYSSLVLFSDRSLNEASDDAQISEMMRKENLKNPSIFPQIKTYFELIDKVGFVSKHFSSKVFHDSDYLNVDNNIDLRIKKFNVFKLENPYFETGHTIMDSIMYLDEAHNLNIEVMQNIIGHVGETSKIIVSGDIAQRREKFNSQSNGFLWAIEKYITKEPNDYTGLIKLDKTMSSEMARLAYK